MRKFASVLTLTAMMTAMTAFGAHGAFAAYDAAGAEEAKKVVQDALGAYITLGKNTGEGLLMNGDITVTPKDKYFEIKLPNLTLVSKSAGKVDIGTVVINASPDDKGDYLASIALPSTLKMIDARGEPRADLKIGSQKFSGVWRPALEIFTKAQLEYTGITGTLLGSMPMSITIGNFKSAMALTDNGDGTWSGPRSTEITNVMLKPTTGPQSSASVDSLTASMTLDHVNLAAAKALRDKAQEKLATHDTQMTPEEARSLFDETLRDSTIIPEGFHNSFALKGLHVDITRPPADTELVGKSIKFNLASAQGSTDATGLKADKGEANAKFSLAGLNVLEAPPELIGMIPSEANLDISLKSLPMKQLAESFIGVVSSAIDASAATGEAATAPQKAAEASIKSNAATMLLAVPAQLTAAGSSLIISNTYTKAADVQTDLNGQFAANATSPYMAVGSITLAIHGLDELVQKLNKLDVDTANKNARSYAQGLALLQLQGQPGKEGDKSLRTYKLDMAPDGRVTLNGADISALTSILKK